MTADIMRRISDPYPDRKKVGAGKEQSTADPRWDVRLYPPGDAGEHDRGDQNDEQVADHRPTLSPAGLLVSDFPNAGTTFTDVSSTPGGEIPLLHLLPRAVQPHCREAAPYRVCQNETKTGEAPQSSPHRERLSLRRRPDEVSAACAEHVRRDPLRLVRIHRTPTLRTHYRAMTARTRARPARLLAQLRLRSVGRTMTVGVPRAVLAIRSVGAATRLLDRADTRPVEVEQ